MVLGDRCSEWLDSEVSGRLNHVQMADQGRGNAVLQCSQGAGLSLLVDCSGGLVDNLIERREK